jgi:hypothetical protein
VSVKRQQRFNTIGVVDDPDLRYQRFSLVPAFSSTPDVRTIGEDVLPKLFAPQATWDAKINDRPYVGMPLKSAVSTTTLPAREDVWCDVADVREDEVTEMVITAGMLGKLVDASPGQGAEYDGASRWTVFEGLLVFGPINPLNSGNPAQHPGWDDYLVRFDNFDFFGFGTLDINEPLNPNNGGNRGDRKADGALVNGNRPSVTDLNIEIEYLGGADVDIDYVTLQTPNSRAIMRDMHRAAIVENLGSLVEDFVIARSTANRPDVTIMGLRSIEEHGESHWYAQRYLNILTGGIMFTEMSNHPFDRYRHIAYPFGSNSQTEPLFPLHVWYEAITGRLNPYTPAPYLKWGSEPLTFGLKYGVCKSTWPSDPPYACGIDDPDPMVRMSLQQEQAHAYELGYGCENNTNVISQLQSVPLAYWEHPETFESIDVDGLPNEVPLSCDGSNLFHFTDWPVMAATERSIYRSCIAPGSEQMVFNGASWYEQIWLGCYPKIYGQSDFTPNEEREYVLTGFQQQARPMTAEELRMRLHFATVMGATGVMIFKGGVPSFADDMVQENGVPMFNGPYQLVFNCLDYHDAVAEPGTVRSVEDLQEAYRSNEYGQDFPSQGTPHTVTCANKSIDVEGYLPSMVRQKMANGSLHLRPLWIDKSQYENATGVFSGLEFVQRVSDNGEFVSASAVEKVYFGSRSLRCELLRTKEWFDRTIKPAPVPDCESDGTTVRELLGMLNLQAWLQRGYHDYDRWKGQPATTNPLLRWIDPTRIRSRHPHRELNGRADYEALDSMFLDVTMLTKQKCFDDATYDDANVPESLRGSEHPAEVYIGVLNRRTNPLYFRRPGQEPSDNDHALSFSSSEEFLALVGNSQSNHTLYDQLGARAIVLPFEYQYENGEQAMMLRVQEVGVEPGADGRDVTMYQNDQVAPTVQTKRRLVDTIIDARGTLEVNFLPGEGKVFRVTKLPATTSAAAGYLAFNTQTKVIVAQEQVFQNGVPQQTDKLRYHLVYTRPNTEDHWRVYYKRSVPAMRDALPDLAHAEWEQEYEFGGNFQVVRALAGQRQTLDQTNTGRLQQVYPLGVSTVTHGQPTDIELEAGFPSIAVAKGVTAYYTDGVRNATAELQRVHIVYGQIKNTAQDNMWDEVHIVEHQFDDFATPQQVLPGVPRSLSMIQTAGPGNQYDMDVLAAWGTPTSGVARCPDAPLALPEPYSGMTTEYSDRIFTAWSVNEERGITSSVRTVSAFGGIPGEEWNLLNAEIDEIVITQGGGLASYPSLTPQTSPLGHKWPHASLVWQEASMAAAGPPPFEGAPQLVNGTSVMYTRVFDDVDNVRMAGRHDYGVPGALTMHYATGLPPDAHGIHIFPLVNIPPPPVIPEPWYEHVMRISEVVEGGSNLYPTIVRSSASTAPTSITFSSDIPTCPPATFEFQYEGITWQNMELAMNTSRIRRRFFILDDDPLLEPGPGKIMRYWWMGSTGYAPNGNYVAPVIADAHTRLGTQVFNQTTAVYNELYYASEAPGGCHTRMTINGNISDTSMVSAFGIVSGDFTGNTPRGSLPWLTWGAAASIEQVPLRDVPFPPHQGALSTEHFWTRDPGEWPHISARAHGVDHVKQTLRRVFQRDGDGAPTITSSAEQFYKGNARGRRLRVFGGYSNGEDDVSISAHLPDGTELHFRQEAQGTGGMLETAVLALVQPIGDLVTEPFDASVLTEADVEVDGMARDGYVLFVDELDDADSRALRGTTISRTSMVGLPTKPEPTDAVKRKVMKTVFENPRSGRRYRFRLHSIEPSVAFELQSHDRMESEFRKEGTDLDIRVVDLERGTTTAASDTAEILVLPNPSQSEVRLTVLARYAGSHRRILTIVDALGTVTSSLAIDHPSQLLDVSHLPSGMYSLTLTEDGLVTTSTRMIVRR